MPPDTKTPKLSIIIVTFESENDLQKLLPSLKNQTLTDFETIVIDNSESQKVRNLLETCYVNIRYIRNDKNTGYAGGNNLGVKQALSDTILILNPDTELNKPTTLETLFKTSQTYPHAFINPKLLQPNGTINTLGLQMHYTGISTCKALGEKSNHYKGTFYIPFLSGSAIIGKKQTFQTLKGFDESYFMYMEDIDLSLRAKQQGYTLLCNANTEVTHHYSLNMTANKFYYLEHNRLKTILKNYEYKTLLKITPALLLTDLATLGFALIKGFPYLKSYLKARVSLWRNLKTTQVTRNEIQTQRNASDNMTLEGYLSVLPLEQLMQSPNFAKFLRNITTPLYQFSKPKEVNA